MTTKEELIKLKRITNVTFNIGFEPISRIEKHMYALESRLKKQFPDEIVDTKVPYDFVPQAPRFLLRNTKKKRFLEVSLVRAKLKLQIVDDYSRDIQKGVEFFKSQVKTVFDSIKEVVDPSFEIMAGFFRIEYSTFRIPDINPERFFCDKFLKDNVVDPYLFTSKLTYVEEDKYYVNYLLDNFKKIEGQVDLKGEPLGKQIYIKINPYTSKEFVEVDRGISITLNINNRYVLNGLSSTVTEIDPTSSINEIFEIAENRINGLEEFVL